MSVDLRTRVDVELAPLEAGSFFRDTLPPLLDAHQADITPGARELRLKPFCIEVDGEAWTLTWDGDRVSVAPGTQAAWNARRTHDPHWQPIPGSGEYPSGGAQPPEPMPGPS